MKLSQDHVNNIAYRLVGCAIEVHKELGPGLLEGLYEECLIMELINSGLDVKCQKLIVPTYKGVDCATRLRYDLLVEDCVLVENKSVEHLHPIHQAQLMSYMKLLKVPKGLLINFNVLNITKEGLIPLVNEIFRQLPVTI